MCETWKMRALLKIVSNEFEMRTVVPGLNAGNTGGHTLYLDGLQYTTKELDELTKLITSYNKQEQVIRIRLQENSLDDNSVEKLLQLVALCPYLNHLDLKGNRIQDRGIDDLHSFMEQIPGVTNVMRDPVTKDLRARSGPQVRLTIVLEDQLPPAEGPTPGNMMVSTELSVNAADDFLSSAAGVTTQKQLQGPDASMTQMPSFSSSKEAPRTVMAPQQSAFPQQMQQRTQPPGGMQLPDGVGRFGGVPIGLGGAGEVSRLGPRGSSPARDSTLPRISSEPSLGASGRPSRPGSGRTPKGKPSARISQ